MESIRIAVVQVPWPGNRDAMKATYQALAKRAAHGGATVLCLQEMSLSPYFCSVIDPSLKDQWAEPLKGGESQAFFSELAKGNGLWVIGHLYEKDPTNQDYYNTAVIHNPQGEMTGHTRKIHIPSGIGYEETSYFTGWNEYPIHDIAGFKVATPTCYDQWFPELARIYALKGAEFIFYPTAIGHEPTALGVDSKEAWQTVMRSHCIANGIYVAAANRVGVEGVRFYGSSFVCEPSGTVVSQASRDQTEIIFAELDRSRIAHWRRLFPLLTQRRPEVYSKIVELPSQ